MAFTVARQARLAEAQQSVAEERERGTALAGQAKTLKELIEAIERELNPAKRAGEAPHADGAAGARGARARCRGGFRRPGPAGPKSAFFRSERVVAASSRRAE